eukprot:366476-Chlamydomonas_euryale.AAC.5
MSCLTRRSEAHCLARRPAHHAGGAGQGTVGCARAPVARRRGRLHTCAGAGAAPGDAVRSASPATCVRCACDAAMWCAHGSVVGKAQSAEVGLVAPLVLQWKLGNAARLGRAEAWRALGERELAADDATRQVWGWVHTGKAPLRHTSTPSDVWMGCCSRARRGRGAGCGWLWSPVLVELPAPSVREIAESP